MLPLEVVGYIAGTLTTGGVTPEIIKVIRTRDTRGISLTWLFVMLVGSILWVAYGLYIGSTPVVFFNVVGAVLYFIFIIIKVLGSRWG